MNLNKKRLNSSKLYAITDLKCEDPQIFKKVDQALRGGADIIQLRSKTLLDGPFLRIAAKLAPIIHRRRKLFILNDRVHLMLVSKADGIHLGQEDLPYAYARKILGRSRLIGRSTHSLQQAVKAEKEGHDYIGVGPVFGTPTKPDYIPVGLELVHQVSHKLKIPYVAIGGIDASNIHEVLSAGATKIAVVRAVFAARNPENAARELKDKIRRNHGNDNFIRKK